MPSTTSDADDVLIAACLEACTELGEFAAAVLVLNPRLFKRAATDAGFTVEEMETLIVLSSEAQEFVADIEDDDEDDDDHDDDDDEDEGTDDDADQTESARE